MMGQTERRIFLRCIEELEKELASAKRAKDKWKDKSSKIEEHSRELSQALYELQSENAELRKRQLTIEMAEDATKDIGLIRRLNLVAEEMARILLNQEQSPVGMYDENARRATMEILSQYSNLDEERSRGTLKGLQRSLKAEMDKHQTKETK